WAEKGTLEEKLLKWSDAAQTYSKLYELSYRNPAWMVRVAQNQARLKQPDAVVKSLRTAFLEGKPDRATEYFEIARKLSDWGMLTEAQQFADQGFPKLKPRDPENLADLRTYISLAARARTYEAAYAKLSSVVEPSSRAFLFLELANVARQYFTPEEKTVLGSWFRKLSAADPGLDLTGAANAAGLADVEVALLIDRMRRGPGPGSPSDVQRLADLQKRRMRFDDLANQIEAYTKQLPPDGGRNDYLPQVADAFRLGGSYNNELRVLGVLDQMSLLSGPSVARYNFLLRTAQPTKLIQVAQSGSSVEIRNGAAQTAISGDDASLALRAVAARGAGLPPVWTKAYTALTGLHFAQVSPEVEAAFTGALGTLTVGEQLGHIPDRAQQLVGAAWFPYGASYGMYLRISGKNAEAEDYLPAALEGRPASARAYASLAETYAEAGDAAQALTEYTHALQFNHLNPEVQTRMALLESGRGNMREATEHLRSALMILAEQQDRGSVPESFWNDTVLTLEAIGRLKAFNALRKEATTLLSTYFRRNDTYRAEPLIRAALNAPESASEGFAWVQELARSSVAPVGFLSSIIDVSWLTDEQKLLLNAQILEISNLEVARTRGQANEYAVLARDRTKIDYASALVKAGRLQEASAQLNELSATARVENQQKLLLVEAQIAARSNSLPALLDRYAQMEAPPSNDLLRSVANTLRAEGNKTASLIILERVYQADVAAVWPPPSASLLGLAEVRLEQGNAQKAVAELRRAVLLSEEGPSLIDSAASLLERFGRNVEAEEFRVRIASMAPWDRSNLAALALLKKDNAALGSLARSPETPYSSRAAAASVLAGATDLGSGELNYLANPTQDPKDAEKPYWFAARVKAAERSQDPAVKFRLLRGAIEIDPSAEAIRLPLFRAALAVNRNQGAVGVWAPLLDAGPVGRVLVQFRDTNDGTDVRYLTTEFLSAYPDRALIARELAGAYRKLGYLPAAEMLLRISQRIAPSPSIEAEIAQLEAEQKAIDANARRAPVIRQALEMEKPVRPRLLVSSAKPATITGGAR
ncbi:MAG TPA: hypothetical protein VE621_21095, partial [Bryobacteraceae bacterium]|nr:hypothetical protein [Bryobacteraceae bacterium]